MRAIMWTTIREVDLHSIHLWPHKSADTSVEGHECFVEEDNLRCGGCILGVP